jgi:hypothetical protein
VVEVGSTSGRVQDTTGVVLENGFVGLNQNGDGLLGDSGLHGGDLVGRSHLTVGGGFHSSVTSAVVFAGLVFSLVGVRSLRHEVVSSGVVECTSLETSIATVVSEACSAIDELLLRELQELVGLNKVLGFKSGGSGEGPA